MNPDRSPRPPRARAPCFPPAPCSHTAPFAPLPLILRVNLPSENESLHWLLFLLTTGSTQATPWAAMGGWNGKNGMDQHRGTSCPLAAQPGGSCLRAGKGLGSCPGSGCYKRGGRGRRGLACPVCFGEGGGQGQVLLVSQAGLRAAPAGQGCLPYGVYLPLPHGFCHLLPHSFPRPHGAEELRCCWRHPRAFSPGPPLSPAL